MCITYNRNKRTEIEVKIGSFWEISENYKDINNDLKNRRLFRRFMFLS